jgi:hypothetical protein
MQVVTTPPYMQSTNHATLYLDFEIIHAFNQPINNSTQPGSGKTPTKQEAFAPAWPASGEPRWLEPDCMDWYVNQSHPYIQAADH